MLSGNVFPRRLEVSAIEVTSYNVQAVTAWLASHGVQTFKDDPDAPEFMVLYTNPEEITLCFLGQAPSHPQFDEFASKVVMVTQGVWLVYSVNGLEIHTNESFHARYETVVDE